MTAIDEDGKVVEKQSIYQSWGATDNAMVATNAGNRGVVTVLNELGKSLTKNMTRLIFDLSEGSDKKRLNTNLNTRVSKGYSTTFISTGEISLLEKCDTKLEGLAVRVMEITKPLTKDAEHANRIKAGCFANCGFAAPMLAKHIIRKGGVDYVLPIYQTWLAKLRARFPKGNNTERFVEKFAALFVTTAEIATDALKLPFDIDVLLAFMEEYDQEHGAERNTSAASYDIIIHLCRSQLHKFFVRHDKSLPKVRIPDEVASSPIAVCWGRITNMAKEHTDGRLIVQEFEIRKETLHELLSSKRINNKCGVSYQITAEGERDPLTSKRERRYKTITGTKKQAEAELRKMIAELESGSIITASSMKLSAWMATWLSTYLPNIEQTTRDSYQEKIDNYIIPALGHIPLKAIKTNDIQIWINDLISKGKSPKTIRNVYNNLNAALKKAVILRMIPFNPCEGTVLPKLQKYQAQVFNTTDIQQALAAADSLSIYLIILLGANVGLRRGEMAALQWKDINFSASTVSISQNRVHTKNSVVQKAPKSQAGNRTITVGTDSITALSEAKAVYDDAVLNKPGFKNLGYVLCKENGEPFHPDSITQKWERFITKQTLPQIRLHDLRHSNATALIAAGVSAKVVQHRLGHANVSITLNTYTHVLPSMDEEAAEQLDNALFSSTQPINHPPIII